MAFQRNHVSNAERIEIGLKVFGSSTLALQVLIAKG